jgi:hypothetical protein
MLLWAGVGAVLLENVMEIFSYLVHPRTPSFPSWSGNVQVLRKGPHLPVGVPVDGLVQVGGQDFSLRVTYLAVVIVSADHPEATHCRTSINRQKICFLTEVSIADNLLHMTSGAKSGDCPCFVGL